VLVPLSPAIRIRGVAVSLHASAESRARYRDKDASGYGGVTDDYVVVDLLGSYRYSDGMELFARVVNLFDENYQVTYGTNTLGRSVYVGARLGF